MPLLPLRALPVNESHEGPLVIRIDPRPTGSVYVYVRRESDKQTWICKVRSLQEISAPTQQSRPLTVASIATCLYHGTAYDSFAAGVALHRKEVSFTQPESWRDGGYRLTMRVSVRSSSVGLAVPAASPEGVATAVPVAEIVEDDVVFGFNLTLSTENLDHESATPLVKEKRAASVQTIGAAFPNARLNWESYKNHDFMRVSLDGISIVNDGFRSNRVELTLDIVHVKTPALFVLSINSKVVDADHAVSYQTAPGSDLLHTIAQYDVRIPAKAWVQVTMLEGSAPAIEGSKLTVREMIIAG